jgi:hypothetical protein
MGDAERLKRQLAEAEHRVCSARAAVVKILDAIYEASDETAKVLVRQRLSAPFHELSDRMKERDAGGGSSSACNPAQRTVRQLPRWVAPMPAYPDRLAS